MLPTDRRQWYGQAGRRLESKRKTTDGKRKRAGNVQYPVRSSLIYGRRGDLAPRLRYNTYVTDMREIPRSRDTRCSFCVYASLSRTTHARGVCAEDPLVPEGGLDVPALPSFERNLFLIPQ